MLEVRARAVAHLGKPRVFESLNCWAIWALCFWVRVHCNGFGVGSCIWVLIGCKWTLYFGLNCLLVWFLFYCMCMGPGKFGPVHKP